MSGKSNSGSGGFTYKSSGTNSSVSCTYFFIKEYILNGLSSRETTTVPVTTAAVLPTPTLTTTRIRMFS